MPLVALRPGFPESEETREWGSVPGSAATAASDACDTPQGGMGAVGPRCCAMVRVGRISSTSVSMVTLGGGGELVPAKTEEEFRESMLGMMGSDAHWG
jgi:hypothetical protein